MANLKKRKKKYVNGVFAKEKNLNWSWLHCRCFWFLNGIAERKKDLEGVW